MAPGRLGFMASTNTYVSLFSSGGLGCFGFKQAGFECVATAELIERRMNVQRANEVCKNEAGYVVGDLKDPKVRARVISNVANFKFSHPNEDLTAVIATPPCQGMSVANHKKTSTEIIRNSLVVESIKLISELRPKYFILENVRSFLKAQCVDIDDNSKSISEAINSNLGVTYNIAAKTLNLKDFGSPSSRTRTIVIGVRRDIADVSPNEMFPSSSKPKTVRQLIGSLPPLQNMDDISEKDHLHHFRPYKAHMRQWIHGLLPGESAFDNIEPENRPHRVIDGLYVANQRKNGDKYRRVKWESIPPCVHTRNDILSSQSTVHPVDDRVFSIRELMLFMGVPKNFKWDVSETPNMRSSSYEEKIRFLREHDTNIRQCLGEGVPTPVFNRIAANIRSSQNGHISTTGKSILDFEKKNSRRRELSAYYTRQDIAFTLANNLPLFKDLKRVRILEPSVGAGALLPSLLMKYADKKVELTILDLDPEALGLARRIADNVGHENLVVNSICADFLTYEFIEDFDLVVGNPPFGTNPNRKLPAALNGIRNFFGQFLQKSMELSRYVSLILPKSFISAPEHWPLRTKVSSRHIRCITDHGTRAFFDVKIETIGIHLGPKKNKNLTLIDSMILPMRRQVDQSYVVDSRFPTWLLYRDTFFDDVVEKISVGSFTVYRDRSLSKKIMSEKGEVPVLQARNIGNGEIVGSTNSLFVQQEKISRSWLRLSERNDLVAVPNLSYYPRAAPVPVGFVPDGSAAILIPADGFEFAPNELAWFGSELFYYFYRISRNYSVRSLNVDSCSVFYFGLPFRDVDLPVVSMHRDSKALFRKPTTALLRVLGK